MINTRILQYFSLVRYKAIKKILNNNFKLILDMEDSAQNLFSRKKTVFLKKKCREGIEYLTHQKINLKEDFLRINGIKSSYFSKDVKTIKNCQKKGLKIKAIFLPKTESYKEIKYVNKNLKIKIIPIIETIRGYNNLSKILKSDKKNLIYGVHYGHFDYCLNKKIWPFPEPYHEEFWNIVYEIIKTCNKYKKKFIQTPYPLINNDKIMCGKMREKIWSLIISRNQVIHLQKRESGKGKHKNLDHFPISALIQKISKKSRNQGRIRTNCYMSPQLKSGRRVLITIFR